MGRIWLAQLHRGLKGGFSPWAWPRSVEEAAWQVTLALDGVGPHAREESGPGADLGRRGRPVLAKQGAMRSMGRARRSSHASEQEQGKRAPDERASACCRGSGGGRPGCGQATTELGATAATGSRWKESVPERSRRRKALERRCPWQRSSMGYGDVQFLQGGEDDADVLDGHDGGRT